MARETTSTKPVEPEGREQMNLKLPPGTVELARHLGAACNVPLVGIVKAALDLFALAHEVEQRGGTITLVGPDGQIEEEIRLPYNTLRRVPKKPVAGGTPEAPA